ncbi:MAG: type II toxin-antitoxin system VapB family antitoxin [Acidobacteriota bacterium]
MKTTLNFDDQLIRAAKRRAAENGDTLTGLIEKALRGYLAPPPQRRSRFKLDLLTKKGRPVPGVNWDDRDSLYERMEGRL